MNNLALATQENDIETQLRATTSELCENAAGIVIMTRADLSHATDLVKALKSRFRDAEDERKRLVKPFNDGVDAINARFKLMTVPLKEAEDDLKSKMLDFQMEEAKRAREEADRVEKIRLEAEKKRREEAEAQAAVSDRAPIPAAMQEAPPAPIVSLHKPTTYGQTGAVSTVKKQWTFELEDIKALADARPDLVVVDTVKINQEIRGKGGMIPGLRVFEKDVLQVR